MQEAIVFPWGSMRAVAEVLSTKRLPLDHLLSDTLRTQKIVFLASQPESVLADLSICYATPQKAQNCGKCRKCAMTRLALQAVPDPVLRERAEIAMFGDVMDHLEFVQNLKLPSEPTNPTRISLLMRFDDIARCLPHGPLRDAIMERLGFASHAANDGRHTT